MPHRRFRDAEAFLAALELLDAAVTRREVVVLEAGPVWGYTRAQAESCRHVWRNDPVVVLHPIDPTCNLAAVRSERVLGFLHLHGSNLAHSAACAQPARLRHMAAAVAF